MRSLTFRPGDNPKVNFALLALTLVTTCSTFAFTFGSGFSSAAVFAISLVLILGSHEMGHYLLARIHDVDTSLPYFIPLPFLGVGTLGAVIRIRGRIPNRNALVDIGAAGPLAGLVVAIPLLIFGLVQSKIVDLPVQAPDLLGESSLVALFDRAIQYIGAKLGGTYHPPPDTAQSFVFVFGDNLLMRALKFLVLGPLPPGKDIQEHPMVIAGWFGLLVTMLNLVPIGQLDGGHLTYALFGDRAGTIGRLMALAMFALCLFYSAGWLLWLIVTSKFIGFRHPEVVEPQVPLSPGRKLTCALCFVALAACVMPVPLTMVSLP
jgi:membrane-associated protease RseP (regulator of RpoE activity)